MRSFKRFIKLLVTNLVDCYPENSKFVMMLLTEIRSFTRMRMRLWRFSFTFIGM